MNIFRSAILVLAAALVLAPAAWTTVTNQFRVAAHVNGQGYARHLSVVIRSPSAYVLDYAGRGGNDAAWKGPRYEATGSRSLGGVAALGWSAGIYLTPSNKRTIAANLTHDWDVVAQGAEPIERRVGGRAVGTVRGTWVLTQADAMAGEARYEAGLVFPMCGRTLLVVVSALTPSGDSAGGSMGFGEYVIEGMKPTVWNRLQVLETLRGIRLDGNLPAGRVTAARRGARVSGRVTDCNGHPLAAQAVVLERQAGRRWQVVSRGRTNADGSFALSAAGTGPFRVTAGSRRSGVIR